MTVRFFTPCEECERTGRVTIYGIFGGELDEVDCPACGGDGRTETKGETFTSYESRFSIPVHLATVPPTVDPYNPFEEVTA